MHQPEIQTGSDVTIKELDGFGTDAPSLFSLLIHDNFSEPRGTASDFTLTNGKVSPIKGKKYTYIYQEDELAGIG